jgi:hypothetical protein
VRPPSSGSHLPRRWLPWQCPSAAPSRPQSWERGEGTYWSSDRQTGAACEARCGSGQVLTLPDGRSCGMRCRARGTDNSGSACWDDCLRRKQGGCREHVADAMVPEEGRLCFWLPSYTHSARRRRQRQARL